MEDMRKIRIALVAIIILLCFSVFAGHFIMLTRGDTVDCIGVVEEIDNTWNKVRVKGTADNVEYLFFVMFSSFVYDEEGSRIKLKDLSVGDIICVNYCGQWESSDKGLYVQTIELISKINKESSSI